MKEGQCRRIYGLLFFAFLALVLPGDPEELPLPGVNYLNGQKQEHQEVRKKVNQIAMEIFIK